MRMSGVGEAEAIAFAPHGVQEARAPGVVADRAAQGDDVVVDGPERSFRVETADLLDDVETRHDLAATCRKHPENEDVVGREVGAPARPVRRELKRTDAPPNARRSCLAISIMIRKM